MMMGQTAFRRTYVTDVSSAIRTRCGSRRGISNSAERLTRLLETPFMWSGAITGRALYNRLQPPGGLARTLIELVDPIKLLRGGAPTGRLRFGWTRPPSSAEATMAWCHGYDQNAAYRQRPTRATTSPLVAVAHSRGIEERLAGASSPRSR